MGNNCASINTNDFNFEQKSECVEVPNMKSNEESAESMKSDSGGKGAAAPPPPPGPQSMFISIPGGSNQNFSPTGMFNTSYSAVAAKVPSQPKVAARSKERTIHSGMYSAPNGNREILWNFAGNKFLQLEGGAKVSLYCKSSSELRRVSALHRDQSLTHTAKGVEVVAKVTKRVMTQKQLDMLRQNPPSPDMLLLTKAAFCNLDLILPGLYLTAVTGLIKENFSDKNIKLIINATHELPLLESSEFVSFRVPVEDSEEDRSIGKYLEDVADLIDVTRQDGGSTIVHCMGGISRSTTLVLAYMVKYTSLNLHESFRHVYASRRVVRPNMVFMRLLADFEARLNKCASFKFLTFGSCVVPDFFEAEFPDLFMAELNRQRVNFTDHDGGKSRQVRAKSCKGGKQAKQR